MLFDTTSQTTNFDQLAGHPLFQRTSVYAELQRTALGFIDIGARGGVHNIVAPVAAVTEVVGFEPDAEACREIQTQQAAGSPWAKIIMMPVALADRIGTMHLQLHAVSTNHSLLPANSDYVARYDMVKFQRLGSEPVQTTTLDAVLFGASNAESHWGEFLKLDTQGSEFEILAGARRTLSERTVAIVTEVSFFEVYRGQKLFSEVELALRDLGFSFYGLIVPHSRSTRQIDKRCQVGAERLMQADAIFFKDPLPGGPCRGPLSSRGCRVLFTCALLLGYFDFALELAGKTFASGDELSTIRELLQSIAWRSPRDTRDEVATLLQNIEAEPSLANVRVGKFVDRRRHVFDYDDFPEE